MLLIVVIGASDIKVRPLLMIPMVVSLLVLVFDSKTCFVMDFLPVLYVGQGECDQQINTLTDQID